MGGGEPKRLCRVEISNDLQAFTMSPAPSAGGAPGAALRWFALRRTSARLYFRCYLQALSLDTLQRKITCLRLLVFPVA
jgi:hypothetical protein